MSDELTNAPNPVNQPASDPLKSGYRTTEFLGAGAGMFLTSLLALLAVFNVVNFTPEQKQSIYDFAGVAWMVLPSVYAAVRAHVKGKALVAGVADRVAAKEGQ